MGLFCSIHCILGLVRSQPNQFTLKNKRTQVFWFSIFTWITHCSFKMAYIAIKIAKLLRLYLSLGERVCKTYYYYQQISILVYGYRTQHLEFLRFNDVMCHFNTIYKNVLKVKIHLHVIFTSCNTNVNNVRIINMGLCL